MTLQDPYCEVVQDGERATLRFSRNIVHPPAMAWRALTESDHLRWWMPVDMIGERAAGAIVRMVFWPDLVEKKNLDPDAGMATIQVWDPPSVFEWVWHGSLVRFEITATSAGCELRSTVAFDAGDPETIVDNAGGYHLWMDHLAGLLNTGFSMPIADADPQPLAATYRAKLNFLDGRNR